MGNCLASNAAALVIQHPCGKMERLYRPVTAGEVMRSNPGHYVSLTIPLPMQPQQQEQNQEQKTVPLTRVKLLRPTETLSLGHAYRLITAQECLGLLKAKKHTKTRKAQAEAVEKHNKVQPEKQTSVSEIGGESEPGKTSQTLKRPPTHEEVFKETHTHKGEKTVWVDPRFEAIYGDYVQRLKAVFAKDQESFDEDALWSKMVGGLYKSTQVPSLVPEVVEDMVRTQVHALNEELQKQNQEMWKNKEAIWKKKWAKKMEKKVEKKVASRMQREVQQQMQQQYMQMQQMHAYFELMRACSSTPLPPPPPAPAPPVFGAIQHSSSSSSSSSSDDDNGTGDDAEVDIDDAEYS